VRKPLAALLAATLGGMVVGPFAIHSASALNLAEASTVIGNQSESYQTSVPDNPACVMGARLVESPEQTLSDPTVHVSSITLSGSITCTGGADFVELVVSKDGSQCADHYTGGLTSSATYSTSASCTISNPSTGTTHSGLFHFRMARSASTVPDGPCTPDPTNNDFLYCDFTLSTLVVPPA
jgi:hypothetical protein